MFVSGLGLIDGCLGTRSAIIDWNDERCTDEAKEIILFGGGEDNSTAFDDPIGLDRVYIINEITDHFWCSRLQLL